MSRTFNGSSDRGTYTAAPIPTFPFTVMGWVYLTSPTTEQYFFSIATNDGGDASYITLGTPGTTGRVQACVRFSGSNLPELNASAAIATNTWTFVAGEFAGTGMSCTSRKAVIGTNVSAGTDNTGTLGFGTTTLFDSEGASTKRTGLGARLRSTTDKFTGGNLAYFAIVNKIPSGAEYTSLQTNAPHLVFTNSGNHVEYWRLDQNDSPVNDEWQTGATGDLTLTGTAHSTNNPSITVGAADATPTMGRCIYILP